MKDDDLHEAEHLFDAEEDEQRLAQVRRRDAEQARAYREICALLCVPTSTRPEVVLALVRQGQEGCP